MSDAALLLPCPFCNADADIFEAKECGPRAYIAGCTNAMCQSSSKVIFALKDDVTKQLVEAWNRRASGPFTPTGFAAELMMTGGNHLANILIKNLGADFADRLPWMAGENARKTLRGDDYDVWCCWSAIMRARDLIEGGPEKGIAL